MYAYEARKYNSIEGTLSAGATAYDIPITPLKEALYCLISNDSQSSFTIKFNGANDTTSPAITLKAGETYSISNVMIKTINFTNRSGSTIDYRVSVWGK